MGFLVGLLVILGAITLIAVVYAVLMMFLAFKMDKDKEKYTSWTKNLHPDPIAFFNWIAKARSNRH